MAGFGSFLSNPTTDPTSPYFNPTNATTGGLLGGQNSVANQVTTPGSLIGIGGNTVTPGSLLANPTGTMQQLSPTNLISQLTPQNTFQANAPLNSGQLAGYVGGSQQNLAGVNGQQGQLVNALMAQSQGQGPNPANAELNQATNQGIQQATGQIASQKGISPALAARQSSMNAAGATQQAAQAGAIMNAQQQLAAQSGAANVLGQQAGQNIQNTATTGGLANQSSLGSQGINAATSAQNAAANQNVFGGLLNAAGAGLASALSRGGTVGGYDDGGTIGSLPGAGDTADDDAGDVDTGKMFSTAFNTQTPQVQAANQILASSGVPNYMPSYTAGGANIGKSGGGSSGGIGAGIGALAALAHGGKVPSHLSHIAQIYHPNFNTKGTTHLKARGGPVPGKAKVAGDSPKNDTVKTMLSPGEVVIPRSIMESEDPVKMASKFVANELAKRGSSQDDFKMALKKAISTRKAS